MQKAYLFVEACAVFLQRQHSAPALAPVALPLRWHDHRRLLSSAAPEAVLPAALPAVVSCC